MVQVKDIMAVMEGIAPRKLAESWDKPGLAVGDPNHEVKKILVALDEMCIRDRGFPYFFTEKKRIFL